MQLFSIKSREQFFEVACGQAASEHNLIEHKLAKDASGKTEFYLSGHCNVCDQDTQFYGDWLYSDGKMPNYRERLVCGRCQLNNRHRFVAYLVKRELSSLAAKNSRIFCYEAVTPFFKWLSANYPNAIGSEFLGLDIPSGSIVRGIRHEDALNLSFPDNSMDLLISQDVFEHVPDLAMSLKEVGRVLKPDGVIIFSVPFYAGSDGITQRARLIDGEIDYLAEPVYHANPVDKNGSLVFWDIGWDIFKLCCAAGIELEIVATWSLRYGHIGELPFVFRGTKRNQHRKNL
jgi:SAM-dependent methyltransferase